MFYLLMITTFFISLIVSLIVIYMFSSPMLSILARIIHDPIHSAWVKYTKFAGIVVGISSGVRIYDMEKYITPLSYSQQDHPVTLVLTQERWVLEIYRTLIETLQGLAWMFLIFFLVALIAYVIVRKTESRSPLVNHTEQTNQAKDEA